MGRTPVGAGLVLALAAAVAVSAVAQAEALTVTPPEDKVFTAYHKLTPLTTRNYGMATATTAAGETVIPTHDAPRYFPIGTTTITWTATTPTATASATQLVTMRDTRGPQITVPPCLTFEATGTLTPLTSDDYGDATATDTLSGVRSITNNAPTAGFPLGLTFIKYTATDNQGNKSSKSSCVYIIDTTPPKITTPPQHIIEATGTLTSMNSTDYGVATATDLVATSTTITNNAPKTFPVGSTSIEWTATDSHKNTSTRTQIVTVVDTTPPTLTPPPTAVIEASAPLSQLTDSDLGEAMSTDSVDSTPTVENGLSEGLGKGVHRITWSATDDSGNTRWATQVVAIVDTTPPALTAPRAAVIDSKSPVSSSLVDIGTPSVVEAVGLSGSPTNDAPSMFPLGETTVTWTATDTSGLSGSTTQKVTVVPSKILKTITPPNPAASWSDGFGHRLAHTDGLLFVSNTKYSKETLRNVGAVYVYDIEEGTLDRTLHYLASTQRADQYFGGSITIVDKSGSQDHAVAIGAKGYDTNGKFVGSVQIFDAKTGTHLRTINNPAAYAASAPADAGMDDAFGAFSASLGDKIVIASHKYSEGTKSNVGRVYVHDVATGRLLHTIQNPDADAGDLFGRKLAAFEDSTGEYVYVGSREDNDKMGAVYAFKLGTTTARWTATAVPGTSDTKYAFEAIVPDGSGGLFVGEPSIQSGTLLAGKVRHYNSDGSLSSTIEPHECCARAFGSRLAVANGLLYAGDQHAGGKGKITAYNVATGEYEGAFTNPGAAKHFGFALEPLGGTRLAASEQTSSGAVRVHTMDLPSIAGLRPPAPGASGTSGASEAIASPPLKPPTLSSTSHSSGTVTLTYNVDIDPFEVDPDDYDLGTAHAVTSVAVSGKTVTLAYISVAQDPPNPVVSTVGDLGLYAIPGGEQ